MLRTFTLKAKDDYQEVEIAVKMHLEQGLTTTEAHKIVQKLKDDIVLNALMPRFYFTYIKEVK